MANANEPPCLEGWLIEPEDICTASCRRGFIPSAAVVNCTTDYRFVLPEFECLNLCEGIVPARGAEPCETDWCEDAQCGSLVVTHGEGGRWPARGLFGHIPCATFRSWIQSEGLSRTDILVVTPEDLSGTKTGDFRDQGLTGAIVLVDTGCDLQTAGELHPEELLRRLFQHGLVPPADREELEPSLRWLAMPELGRWWSSSSLEVSGETAAQLFDRAGGPPAVPEALRCWDATQTLYVGADRRAAAAYAASVEVPPGALTVLARAASGDLQQRLAVLRSPQPVPHPAVHGRKLLAYLADTCLSEAEALFNMIVRELSGLGVIEALGTCHGSYPETRPARWTDRHRQAAHRNPAKVLADYRFSLVFEASADSGYHCPQHVGKGLVLEALAAQSIPIYRGPQDASVVVNESSMLFVRPATSLKEALERLRSAAECEGEAGWFDAGTDRSCDEGCAAVGLVCTEEALFAHNKDVDSSAEVLASIRKAGGHTSAAQCDTTYGRDPDVPQWGSDVCERSSMKRSRSSVSCAARPSKSGEGRHRLCFCHSADGCAAAAGWHASAVPLPAASAKGWFAWDSELRGQASELGRKAAAKLSPLASGSPRARCAAFGCQRRKTAGVGYGCAGEAEDSAQCAAM